jgi:hypothetical protein
MPSLQPGKSISRTRRNTGSNADRRNFLGGMVFVQMYLLQLTEFVKAGRMQRIQTG